VAAGLIGGLGVASASSAALASVLYEVRPHDPMTFVVAATALVTVALLAALLPAWRASRVDGVIVLTGDRARFRSPAPAT